MNTNENNQLNNGQDSFGLPGDYFQRSANSIRNKIEWQEEHKLFPNLIQYKTNPGFIVPEQYFNTNEQQLELIDFPTLNALQKINTFKIPEDYFIESQAVLSSEKLILNEDELHSFATLNTLTKQNNFKITKPYFSENEASLQAILQTKKAGKVIRLSFAKAWYAAAALLAVALGFWTYGQYFKPVEETDCGTIACIDKVDLIKTKTLDNLDNEDLYEIVNSKNLEEHLNSGTGKKNETEKKDSSTKNAAVNELLDEI